MGVPIPYTDPVYVAINIADGLIDVMKAETRVPAVQRGYWTELERLIDASENPPAHLVMSCLQSFREFFSKMVV